MYIREGLLAPAWNCRMMPFQIQRHGRWYDIHEFKNPKIEFWAIRGRPSIPNARLGRGAAGEVHAIRPGAPSRKTANDAAENKKFYRNAPLRAHIRTNQKRIPRSVTPVATSPISVQHPRPRWYRTSKLASSRLTEFNHPLEAHRPRPSRSACCFVACVR